jgi:hypothetical protein
MDENIPAPYPEGTPFNIPGGSKASALVKQPQTPARTTVEENATTVGGCGIQGQSPTPTESFGDAFLTGSDPLSVVRETDTEDYKKYAKEQKAKWYSIWAAFDALSNALIRNVEKPTADQIAPLAAAPPSNNYAKLRIADLERLVADRNIEIPRHVTNDNTNARKKIYRRYLEADDLEKSNKGRSVGDILDFADGRRQVTADTTRAQVVDVDKRKGGVLQQVTTTTITRTITSVPSDWIPAVAGADPKDIPRRLNYGGLSDKGLTRILLVAKLPVTEDRETDIESHRAWPKEARRDARAAKGEVSRFFQK